MKRIQIRRTVEIVHPYKTIEVSDTVERVGVDLETDEIVSDEFLSETEKQRILQAIHDWDTL